MTPLLLAAALTFSSGAIQSYQPIDGQVQLAPLPGRPSGSFIQTPTVNTCGKLSAQAVAPDGVRIFKRLDQLPNGVMEHAVWRTVGGCPVREIVFEGQTYYLAAANPHLERLDPATNRIQRPSH